MFVARLMRSGQAVVGQDGSAGLAPLIREIFDNFDLLGGMGL